MWYCGIVVLRWSMIQWWWGWIRTEDGEREILANIYIFIIIFTYSYLLDDVLMHTLRSVANRRRGTRDIYIFIFTRWWCFNAHTEKWSEPKDKEGNERYLYLYCIHIYSMMMYQVHTEKCSEPKEGNERYLHNHIYSMMMFLCTHWEVERTEGQGFWVFASALKIYCLLF